MFGGGEKPGEAKAAEPAKPEAAAAEPAKPEAPAAEQQAAAPAQDDPCANLANVQYDQDDESFGGFFGGGDDYGSDI
jgi:hypothetical protein